VRDRITYAGFRPPEELPMFFAQADVFVLPSRYDGWGVVINQAIGAGLPIVCSDQVGAGHDLVDDRNGAKFRAGDAESLYVAMRRFLDSPEIIGAAGEASRAKAANLSPAFGASKWVDAVERVLAA